ncbi:hypothetical protein [Desulfovibrio legallii]|nr:hypothetical protein [Desulfovibrio legallii]
MEEVTHLCASTSTNLEESVRAVQQLAEMAGNLHNIVQQLKP